MSSWLVAALAVAIALPGWTPATAHPARYKPTVAAPAKKSAKGSLRIRITGVRGGVRPVVQVAGPGGYRKTLNRARTLRRLDPGTYRVRTPRVATPSGTATGAPSKRRVKVRPGRTATVVARYVWTKNPPGTPVTGPPVLPAPDTAAPGVVMSLAASEHTPDSVRLSWVNPDDADLAEVIVRRVKGPSAPAGPTDGTGVGLETPKAVEVTDAGLDADSSYSYAVFTRDAVGNTSGPVSLTTSTTRAPKLVPVFTYPQPGQPDPTIREELVGLLDRVPSGARVEAAFFIITPDYPVVDALINAHDRGVDVRVVLDSGDRQAASTNAAMDATFDRLLAALGGDATASSFAMQCEKACISKEDDSIQHNKFVLMSATGDLGDVVFETTSNMRTGGSGDATWNAAVLSSDNSRTYDSFRAYFSDLAARLSVPSNDYNAVRPPETYGGLTPHYFPRTDGTDTVAQTLASVDCSSAPTVDVMATHFVRTQVRDRLTQMVQAGCGVRVIARADNITGDLCDSLVDGSVDVRIGDEPSATTVGIHGKYLTVTGGADDKRLVWMGSHNLTDNALLRNDETFLLIDDQAVHGAFQTNFQTIWDDPSMSPGCGKVP